MADTKTTKTNSAKTRNSTKKEVKSDEVVKETKVEEKITKTKTSVMDSLNKINESVSSIVGDESVSTSGEQRGIISSNEEIPCKSITFGGLNWVSPKTNAHYSWENIGAIEFIQFGELVTLNNTKRQFLHKPYFIVQDERVIKYFRLDETYEKVAKIHSLKEIFERGSYSEISDTISTAINVNMRDVVISKVTDMRKNGELNNIDIIRLLSDKLMFDLEDLK